MSGPVLENKREKEGIQVRERGRKDRSGKERIYANYTQIFFNLLTRSWFLFCMRVHCG